jgi:hypothetical protein
VVAALGPLAHIGRRRLGPGMKPQYLGVRQDFD